MPVISKVGRSSNGVRVTFALIYVFLVLGSITMIGPFLMMLSSSISSEADIADYRIIPKFLTDENALFARFLNDKYNVSLWYIKDVYRYDLSRIDVRAGTVATMIQDLRLRDLAADPAERKFVAEYDEFMNRGIPPGLYMPGYTLRGGLIGPVNQLYQQWLEKKFGSLSAMNQAYGDQYDYWAELTVPDELINARDWAPIYNARFRDFLEFKKTIPSWQRIPFEGTRKWIDHLKFATDGNLDKLNARLGHPVNDYADVPMPLARPADPGVQALWDEFVRRKWPLRLIQPDENAVREYHSYLQARRKTIDKLNEQYKTRYTSFDEVPWPTGELFEGMRQSDFVEFLKGLDPSLPKLSLQNISLENTSSAFRRWLLARHGGSLDGINRALGTHFTRLDDLQSPHAAWEWNLVTSDPGHWRWAFVKSNYFEVTSFILTKGRALSNTIIFILLSIVIHLTVNPLCAYALSRFNLSYSYKVLLFLLATMAFPAEVTMIPNFLLLRDLGMLNTFSALILPGMASGFSIFILKGFFDTLPKELYEAAQLDGAGELRMFYQITVPLCQPVFAYTALITFTGAYGAFLFALTVCQDPNMWTIMVWLYDLQSYVPEHIKVAALVVAMLPTLLVFVSCQRIIMRGIVLPQMN